MRGPKSVDDSKGFCKEECSVPRFVLSHLVKHYMTRLGAILVFGKRGLYKVLKSEVLIIVAHML